MLSSRLKLLREKKDATQEDVGSIINVEKSTISQYESGKRVPDASKLTKLADYYGVSVDYLLGRTNNSSPVNTLAAHKTDGYDDNLTQEEQTAVRAFIDMYRKQFKKDSGD